MAFRSDPMLMVYLPMKTAGIWKGYEIEPELIDCCAISQCPRSIVREVPRAQQGEVLVQQLASQNIDIISGLHFEAYLRHLNQPMPGERVAYIAQVVNRWNSRLIVRPGSGIGSLADLPGRTVGIPRVGTPEFNKNIALYLRQNGLDPALHKIRLAPVDNLEETLNSLTQGSIDAAFLQPPYDLLALRRGLEVVEAPPLPIIWSITPMCTSSFMKAKGDLVVRFLAALRDGLRYYKREREAAIAHIQEYFDLMYPEASSQRAVDPQDREVVEHLYQSFREVLDEALYPDPLAINNVYDIVVRQYGETNLVRPLEAWNLTLLQQLG